MDKKPFEELWLINDSQATVEQYVNNSLDDTQRKVIDRTKELLCGFYSPFSLELLPTVDFVTYHNNLTTIDQISTRLGQWSRRKNMFSDNRYIQLAMNRLKEFELIK